MLQKTSFAKKNPIDMTTLATNKRASYDYDLLDKYEAGLVLLGHEVKSIKTGHISLKGAFVNVRGNEVYLTNALVPLYSHANRNTVYDPTRARKLLLKKSEIKSILGKKKVEGLTLVPMRVYMKKGLLKLAFAVGKGKKQHDKRHAISKRETDRKVRRAMRSK